MSSIMHGILCRGTLTLSKLEFLPTTRRRLPSCVCVYAWRHVTKRPVFSQGLARKGPGKHVFMMARCYLRLHRAIALGGAPDAYAYKALVSDGLLFFFPLCALLHLLSIQRPLSNSSACLSVCVWLLKSFSLVSTAVELVYTATLAVPT